MNKKTAEQGHAKLLEAYKAFTRIQENLGKLTRDKLEKITKRALLKDQDYAQAIGKKLVVVRGRAGAGKTIKLIHIAYDLSRRQAQRCLILTFNKALCSDIQRTIVLAKMKSDLDGADVEVRSVHSFICLLLKKLDFYENAESDEDFFQAKYESGKNELLACLEAGALTAADIQEVVMANYDELGWDIILIDEGQDWPKNEKDLLFRLFEPRRFIVADGVDQLVRNEEKTDWTKRVDHHRPTAEKKSLRQKANLCLFENQYASKVGLNWNIEPKLEFHGGKVIIVPGAYTRELHMRLKSICKVDGNTPYEMLFAVPPSLVDQSCGFKLTNEWLGWDVGIAIWDGTQKNTRSDYPRHIDQYRVVQYQSCRGLEGWIAVCLWLDDFVSCKKWEFEQNRRKPQGELIPSIDKDTFAYRWSMIPMTRAVDTLVITLRNPQSEYAQLLRKLQQANEDFVEWVG